MRGRKWSQRREEDGIKSEDREREKSVFSYQKGGHVGKQEHNEDSLLETCQQPINQGTKGSCSKCWEQCDAQVERCAA